MLYLCITILADVGGILLLSKAQGINRPLHLIAGLLAMVVAFVAFSFAAKTMSSTVANAIWSGMSIALVAVASKLVFGEQLSLVQYAFLVVIVVGVVGVQLFERA
jgi:small multidrug resistance pump